MPSLIWKRAKDGTLTLKHKADVYRIAPSLRSFATYELTLNNRPTYKGDKACCKQVALLLTKNPKPAYVTKMWQLPQKDRAGYETRVRNLDLQHFPTAKFPGKGKMVARCVKKGYYPQWNCAGFTDKPRWQVESVCVEVLPDLIKKETRKGAIVIPATPRVTKPALESTEPPLESTISPSVRGCPTPAPERATEGLMRFYAHAGDWPFYPENAKFKTLLAWGEKCRDYWEVRGKYPASSLLAAKAASAFTGDRATLARERVFLIYAKDRELERLIVARMERNCEQSLTEEGKPKLTKGKDRFGYRLGSKAAAVNAVLTGERKSPARISKECGYGSVHGHLAKLVKDKVLTKTKLGNYYLKGESDAVEEGAETKTVKTPAKVGRQPDRGNRATDPRRGGQNGSRVHGGDGKEFREGKKGPGKKAAKP